MFLTVDFVAEFLLSIDVDFALSDYIQPILIDNPFVGGKDALLQLLRQFPLHLLRPVADEE